MATPKVINQQKFALKRNIAHVTGDRVETVSLLPNRGDRPLSFFIPRTNNQLVNLSNIALHLRIRLVSGLDGAPIDPKAKYIIPGFAPATIFDSVSIKINDKEVCRASQYGLMSRFFFLTRVDPERRELLKQLNGWTGEWDDENLSTKWEEVTDGEETDDEATAAANKDVEPSDPAFKKVRKKKTRREKVWNMPTGRFPWSSARSMLFTQDGGRGAITLTSFLLTELTAGGGGDKDLILPPADLSIDWVLSDPSRCILTDQMVPAARVEIMQAWLTVPKLEPRVERGLALRWNYLKARPIPILVAPDRMEHHAVITYTGTIGRRVSLLLLNGDNWDGTWRNSLFRSFHNWVESVELRVAGRTIPGGRMRADFDVPGQENELYLFTRESLKHSLRRTRNSEAISKEKWLSGGFIWSADTTRDGSADAGVRGVAQTGSINLSLAFKKKTTSLLVVVVILETTGELQIDAQGDVQVSDE